MTPGQNLASDRDGGVSVKKIEPHTTGLMTARTVTMACTIWRRFVSKLVAESNGTPSEPRNFANNSSGPIYLPRERESLSSTAPGIDRCLLPGS
jgi:hypothetical protein